MTLFSLITMMMMMMTTSRMQRRIAVAVGKSKGLWLWFHRNWLINRCVHPQTYLHFDISERLDESWRVLQAKLFSPLPSSTDLLIFFFLAQASTCVQLQPVVAVASKNNYKLEGGLIPSHPYLHERSPWKSIRVFGSELQKTKLQMCVFLNFGEVTKKK